MKAVVLPSFHPDAFSPLTEWLPEYMLPVANKPVLEHLIELLVRHKVEDIVVAVKHMPYETEKYFEDGARWGVRISYKLESEFDDVLSSLFRLRSRLDDLFLCIPGNAATDLNVSEMVEAHKRNGCRATFFSGERSKPEQTAPKANGLGFLPFVMNAETLFALENERNGPPEESGDIFDLLREKGAECGRYSSDCFFKLLESQKDFHEANMAMLRNEIVGAIVPGKENGFGTRTGRRAKIAPGVELSPPCLIGDWSRVLKGSRIDGSIVGNNVIVDKNVHVEESVILDGTYVGPHTEIKGAIVGKNRLIDVSRGIDVFIDEDHIIGDLEKRSFSRKMQRAFNFACALALSILFSPVVATLFLYHAIFPSRKYFVAEPRYGSLMRADLEGRLLPKPFTLFRFDSPRPLISKLPGLVNVLKGDLCLVGTSPLTEEETEALNDEWKRVRGQAPSGLFRLWEVETREDLSPEEKLVAENFYAATRSFGGDLKILAKSLLRF